MSDDVRVWIAYHADFSEFAIFTNELLALRYAVDNGMQVREVTLGKGVRHDGGIA